MIPKIRWRFLVFLSLCLGLFAVAPASLSKFAYDEQKLVRIAYDGASPSANDYYSASVLLGNERNKRAIADYALPAQIGEFLAADTTTVGRWMSQDEFEAMQSSQTVQAPLNGAGATHVTVPPNPAAFTPQPSSGSVFVQFDVPTAAIAH